MATAFSEIQANIAKIKADPVGAGDQLLDATSKKVIEMATNLSKAVEGMKNEGATLATHVIDNVVEKSKQLSEAAERAMNATPAKADGDAAPAAAA